MEIKKYQDYLGTDAVNPLLTDFYQFTMIYAHWKNQKSSEHSVFNLYFRKCTFGMNFCIFGGIDECFEFLRDFKFTDQHINYLKTQFPFAEKQFFNFLRNIDMSDIKIYGFLNGDIVLANEPILTIEGPLYKVQLIETTLLNLTNYPTLIASLALKIRLLPGFEDKLLIEDGSINAQSPCGAYLGIKYACVGGVNKTTNLLAAKNTNLDLFISTPKIDESTSLDDLSITDNDFIKNDINVYKLIITKTDVKNIDTSLRKTLYSALLTFATNQFNYNINTKENLEDEILNFSACVYGLYTINNKHEFILILNYSDSIYNIQAVRNILEEKLNTFGINNYLNLKIIIKYNTKMLKEDFSQNAALIDGILLGSDFIVSATQPALGMVYKINVIDDRPCIKFSEEKSKQTIPGFKYIIRLFNESGPLSDFMCLKEEFSTFINSKEITAYNFDEFTTQVKLQFTSCKLMNNLIFQNGKEMTDKVDVKSARKKVLENYKLYTSKNLKLYISEGIRRIIVEETEKMEDINY